MPVGKFAALKFGREKSARNFTGDFFGDVERDGAALAGLLFRISLCWDCAARSARRGASGGDICEHLEGKSKRRVAAARTAIDRKVWRLVWLGCQGPQISKTTILSGRKEQPDSSILMSTRLRDGQMPSSAIQ